MYVNNIGQVFKETLPLKLRFSEGSTLFGKIISIDGKDGFIKLYDGTIIPSIFVSENKLDRNKFYKFLIEDFSEGDGLILRAVTNDSEDSKTDSINTILKNLNIPPEEGKEIIMSLVKFNLPANDENIVSIYKSSEFLKRFKNMSDDDILSFIKNNIKEDINSGSSEFAAAREIFKSLQSVDTDFLSFLIENNIPQNIDNILKAQNFIDNGFFINKIIEKLQNVFNIKNTHSSIVSLEEIIKALKDSPSQLSSIPLENLKSLNDNAEILGHLNENYTLYYFNSYNNSSLFKNSIIIKNKYKASRMIDPDDIRVFITVETPDIGTVESYVYKKNTSLNISLKAEKKYVPIFRAAVGRLKEDLMSKGYDVTSISVEEMSSNNNIVNLSSFFNDSTFKELDVKV